MLLLFYALHDADCIGRIFFDQSRVMPMRSNMR